jgi:hypothetical protein
MDGICPDQWFLDGDIQMLRRCDAIYMIPGWETSQGAREELDIAKSLRMEILYGDTLDDTD